MCTGHSVGTRGIVYESAALETIAVEAAERGPRSVHCTPVTRYRFARRTARNVHPIQRNTLECKRPRCSVQTCNVACYMLCIAACNKPRSTTTCCNIAEHAAAHITLQRRIPCCNSVQHAPRGPIAAPSARPRTAQTSRKFPKLLLLLRAVRFAPCLRALRRSVLGLTRLAGDRVPCSCGCASDRCS